MCTRKPCQNNISVIFSRMSFFALLFSQYSIIVRATMRYLIHKEILRGSSLIKRSSFSTPQTNVYRLAQISALTPLFLWHFHTTKKKRSACRWKEGEKKRTRACGSAYMWTYRYRVSERHTCPEPVNVNYCGIGNLGCCKGMIHGWWKGLWECKRDYY